MDQPNLEDDWAYYEVYVQRSSARLSIEDSEPENMGIIAWDADYPLLGRDVLNRWAVLLDGPGQVVPISMARESSPNRSP